MAASQAKTEEGERGEAGRRAPLVSSRQLPHGKAHTREQALMGPVAAFEFFQYFWINFSFF